MTTEEPTCGMELGSRQSQTYPGNMALKTAAPSRSLTGASNRYVISRATFLGASARCLRTETSDSTVDRVVVIIT